MGHTERYIIANDNKNQTDAIEVLIDKITQLKFEILN